MVCDCNWNLTPDLSSPSFCFEDSDPEGQDHSQDGVQIAVEDHGPGVAVEDRELIFDRFSRGSSAGRRGSSAGVGLGLSFVAEHVNLHGGEVWVEERLDGKEGARFVVQLPVEEQR